MNLVTLLPLLESLLPTAKSIAASNISNPVELALVNGIIDLLKGVADSYIAQQQALKIK